MLRLVFREAEQLLLGVQLQAYTHIPFSSRQENWKLVWALGVKIPVCERTYRTLCTAHPSPRLCKIRSASSLWISFTFCTGTVKPWLVRWCAMNWGVKCRARNFWWYFYPPFVTRTLVTCISLQVSFIHNSSVLFRSKTGKAFWGFPVEGILFTALSFNNWSVPLT